MNEVIVGVPATSANLGPGFDCLALALDLWNTTSFRLGGDGIQVTVNGEGSDILPKDTGNLVAQGFTALYVRREATMPRDVQIECNNLIPLASGLGSSAAAVLSGLLAANFFLGQPLSRLEILRLAVEVEGHADNAAAALFGGLVVVAADMNPPVVKSFPIEPVNLVVVLPCYNLSTNAARSVLPKQVSRAEAVFNLGRAALVVEALKEGNRKLLLRVMEDRLHQPHRLGLIPGAAKAIAAAQRLGCASALSGAGPGVIAFADDDAEMVADAMQAEFRAAGLESRCFFLTATTQTARWYG
ncbi:MAG: homoserine kinase [Chloroflexota bacterium]